MNNVNLVNRRLGESEGIRNVKNHRSFRGHSVIVLANIKYK